VHFVADGTAHRARLPFVARHRRLVAWAWWQAGWINTVHPIDTPSPHQEPAMTTAATPLFAANETRVRSLAAGLALVLTLGLVASLNQVADRQYDAALMADAANNVPTQLVVITATRLPRTA